MLSRRNLAVAFTAPTPNSSAFNLLRTLRRSFKSQGLWNQADPNSFAKIPGVAYPRENRLAESATYKLLPSALFANQLTPAVRKFSVSLCFRAGSRFGSPFVFVTLGIAFPATSFFSQPSELPGGVTLPLNGTSTRTFALWALSVTIPRPPRSPEGATPPLCGFNYLQARFHDTKSANA